MRRVPTPQPAGGDLDGHRGARKEGESHGDEPRTGRGASSKEGSAPASLQEGRGAGTAPSGLGRGKRVRISSAKALAAEQQSSESDDPAGDDSGESEGEEAGSGESEGEEQGIAGERSQSSRLGVCRRSGVSVDKAWLVEEGWVPR